MLLYPKPKQLMMREGMRQLRGEREGARGGDGSCWARGREWVNELEREWALEGEEEGKVTLGLLLPLNFFLMEGLGRRKGTWEGVERGWFQGETRWF